MVSVRGKEENTDPSEILHVSKRSGSWENGKIVGKQKMEVLAERIMDTYGNAVLRLAYTYVHNMSDAEDILQETLIRYLEHRPVFAGENPKRRGSSGWRRI